MKKVNSKKLHLGCGSITPKGWLNVDGSFNARLSKHKILTKLLKLLHIVPIKKNIWQGKIFVHDLRKPLPFSNNSFNIIYSSHVLEHLYLDDAQKLLKECFRVLKPTGIMRIVIPNLKIYVEDYIKEKEQGKKLAADRLNERLLLRTKVRSNSNWFYRQYQKSTDFNSHKWMYDTDSLTNYLTKAGFRDIKRKSFAMSLFKDISMIEKTHHERKPSIYLEAIKPQNEKK